MPTRRKGVGTPGNVSQANWRWRDLWEPLCVSEWPVVVMAVIGSKPHGAVDASYLMSRELVTARDCQQHQQLLQDRSPGKWQLTMLTNF